jgi:hypothetical protein
LTAKHKAQSPDQPAKIGGKSLTLRFSLRAMLALKDKWKYVDDEPGSKNARTADQKVIDRLTNPGFEDFVTILWAATRTHHPELTEEELLDLLDEGGVEGLKDTLNSVLEAGAPPDQGKPRPRTAAARIAR